MATTKEIADERLLAFLAEHPEFSDLRDFLHVALSKRLQKNGNFTDARLVELASNERRRIEKQAKFDETSKPQQRDTYFGLAIGLIAASSPHPHLRGMVFGLAGLSERTSDTDDEKKEK